MFEAHRQRQYPRELLFSTVVELVSLVSLGLRPSLHAAARKAENLPVSLAALYDLDLSHRASERSLAAPLLECAEAGECWIADRNFCTRSLMQGWHDAQAGITRARARPPSAPAAREPLAGLRPRRDGRHLRAADLGR